MLTRVLFALAAMTGPAAALELSLPIACTPGTDCFIQQYVDRDKGPGVRDYACGAETYDGHCMVIAPVLVAPKARGQVWLRSADPAAKPAIITNALSEPEDVESMVAGMRLAREISAQDPLGEIVLAELKPGDGVAAGGELEEDLRRRLMLIYHPVGTARMSDTAPDAVVDSQLRVHGLHGLRVVDASIMPLIPRGNTNAPTIMIAERAADLVRGRAPEPAAHATAPE